MTKREDGQETRWRLLNAACEIFSQKGYREARVAAICKQAGANVASVNYYFRDKAGLYKEAWQHAIQNLKDPVLPESAAGSPKERLREHIKALIRDFTAKGESVRFNRLYLMELVNPTGLIEDAWLEILEPKRRQLHAIIRDIIGPEADDLSILFCELSIVNQYRALVTIKRGHLEYMLARPLSPQLINRLADHIADFSLAGIRAVGKKWIHVP